MFVRIANVLENSNRFRRYNMFWVWKKLNQTPKSVVVNKALAELWILAEGVNFSIFPLTYAWGLHVVSH